MKKRIIYIPVIVVVFMLSACVSMQPKFSEEKLLKRVNGMLTAKINDDWIDVYEYYCENYKKAKSLKAFLKIHKVDFTAYEIVKVNPNPQDGSAEVIVKYDIVVKGGIELKGISHTQKWIMEKGKWMLLVEPGTTPFD
ncbi:MAG: hypothetical protein D3926_06800 [Desulfobacteraceae bacterium]|nr:MAG: hypothetical protein D3926_06800 [Desulfobacteraceae bacterium]